MLMSFMPPSSVSAFRYSAQGSSAGGAPHRCACCRWHSAGCPPSAVTSHMLLLALQGNRGSFPGRSRCPGTCGGCAELKPLSLSRALVRPTCWDARAALCPRWRVGQCGCDMGGMASGTVLCADPCGRRASVWEGYKCLFSSFLYYIFKWCCGEIRYIIEINFTCSSFLLLMWWLQNLNDWRRGLYLCLTFYFLFDSVCY